MNPVHIIPSYLVKIHFHIIHPLRLGLLSDLFPSGFLINILYAPVFSPIRATCPAYLILFDLIILIVLGGEHKLWSSSLYSYADITQKTTYGTSILIKEPASSNVVKNVNTVFLSSLLFFFNFQPSRKYDTLTLMSFFINAIVNFYKMETVLFNVIRFLYATKERKKSISFIERFDRHFREPILSIFFSCDGDFSAHWMYIITDVWNVLPLPEHTPNSHIELGPLRKPLA
jgi:hypothetical protein